MRAPTIAIIGSGPSGCYIAQALRREWQDAEITLIERLPVPYGLVRYGVAPDHPGTKAVTRQFERMFERENIHTIVEKICRDCDEAYARVPAQNLMDQFGRVEKGACLALKAMALWIAAPNGYIPSLPTWMEPSSTMLACPPVT